MGLPLSLCGRVGEGEGDERERKRERKREGGREGGAGDGRPGGGESVLQCYAGVFMHHGIHTLLARLSPLSILRLQRMAHASRAADG